MTLLASLTGAAVAAAEPRVPTIEDLLAIETVGDARVAPDGGRLAWVVRSADLERDEYATQIWVGEPGNDPRPLTRGAAASQPRWSPDGRWLAFVRSAGEPARSQLHLIDPRGGEAFAITSSATGVEGYEWSPDGARIAYTAADPEPEAARKRAEAMGPFHVVRREYAYEHLRVIDVGAARSAMSPGEPLTRGTELSVTSFRWSPDGTRIAFGATTDPDLVSRESEDLYVVSVADGAVRRLVQRPAPDGDPLWSPDGKRILFSTFEGDAEFFYAANNELAVVDAAGGEPRTLTGAFDEEVEAVAWTDAGIYFRALQRTAAHLFHLDPDSGAVRRVSAPDALVMGSVSVSADGRRVGFDAERPDGLAEIYLSALEPFEPRALTRMSDQLEPLLLGRREVISWESRDGTPIEGILTRPRDSGPGGRHPLLVVIHGGPTGTDRPTFRAYRRYPVDLWVARGALILQVNYRGSAGYGEAFRELNRRNLGVGDAWDVLSGVEALIEQGLVDPERVGCMGWSQGGYISAFLTTSSDRFAAISVGAGISNWATYYYNTDITPFTRQYLGADPVADPEVYAKTSPMTYAAQAATPTLIQHGENDRRVPIPNAYELRQGLEDRGVPVEMVVYEGFGHGIDKPRSQRAVMWHNLVWFGHYLWGDPAPDLTAPPLDGDAAAAAAAGPAPGR